MEVGKPRLERSHTAFCFNSALDLPHTYDGDHRSNSPIRALINAPDRLAHWFFLTEGTSILCHSLAFPEFFTGVAPFPAQHTQLFHGLHGVGGDSLRYRMPSAPGLGSDDPIQRSVAFRFITEQLPQHLRARAAAVGALNETLRHVDEQIGPGRVSVSQWFNLYYWHNRAFHWGANDMAIKDVIAWHWTLLLTDESFLFPL